LEDGAVGVWKSRISAWLDRLNPAGDTGVGQGGLFERRRERRRADLGLTVEVFYQDEQRRHSPEVSLGYGWADASDPNGSYSVSWLEHTGELYAMLDGNRATMLGTGVDVVDVFRFRSPPALIEVLGHLDADDLQALLADPDTPTARRGPDGLGWLRRRLDS
jgi:hypothetical protein